jgi:hypothetical protein
MKLSTHLMAINSIQYTLEQAEALALSQGISVTPIASEVSYIFIVHQMSDFNPSTLRTIRGQGYYIVRGQIGNDENQVQHQRSGKSRARTVKKQGFKKHRRIYLSEH